MIKFILPFPPSVNSAYKMSRGKRCKSEKVLAWEKEARNWLNLQNILPVLERCYIVYDLHHPDNRARDAANYEKHTTDFLVTNGILHGDERRYIKGILTQWTDISKDYISVTIYPESAFRMEALNISPMLDNRLE